MSTQIKLIMLCFMALIFTNCETSNKTLTDSGYEFTLHKDVATEKIKAGDFAYFVIDILNDKDSIIQTVRNGPELPVVQIPTKEILSQTPNPVLEVLSFMGLEDSLSLFVPMDSIQAPIPGGGETTFIKYNIVMKESITESEYNQKMTEAQAEDKLRMDANMALEPEIKALGEKLTQDYAAGKLDSKIIKDDSGLQIYMIEEGTGPNAKDGQMVETYYYGFLIDGTSFDNSYKRGKPYPVNLGTRSVIEGWEIALSKMNEGSKAFVIIPYDLGYGANGNPPTIPAKSDLMFYIEIGEIYY